MMMEIAVDYPWRKTFAFNAFVKVKQTDLSWWKELNLSYFIIPPVFMCKNDKDCYGNGYCHARQCKCSANYEYAQDCSHHGCKYIKQTFLFHSASNLDDYSLIIVWPKNLNNQSQLDPNLD